MSSREPAARRPAGGTPPGSLAHAEMLAAQGVHVDLDGGNVAQHIGRRAARRGRHLTRIVNGAIDRELNGGALAGTATVGVSS